MHQKDFIIHVKRYYYYSNKEFQTDCIFNESRNHELSLPRIEIGQGSFTLWVLPQLLARWNQKPLETFRMYYYYYYYYHCSPTTCKPDALNLQGIRSCDRSREQGWREKPSVVRVCRSWGGWLYLCSAISCYLCSAARRNSVSSRANCLSIVNADPETMLYSRRRTVGLVLLLDRGRTYPVFLANSARVFQIAGPSQAQSSLLEVTIREHVRQTKRVVVLLWKKFLALAKF